MLDAMLLLDGQKVSTGIWNRGLAFGDGVFETITFRNRQAPLWAWHMRRLQHACQLLGLEQPDDVLLDKECMALLPQADGIIRITLIRAETVNATPSLSAYGSEQGSNAVHRVLRYRPLPESRSVGLRTDWAEIRLSAQPLLAGIKHLNRLEQVLAAREAAARQLDELLLMDAAGQVIEAISSNLLVYDGNHWITPELHDSGVAGVMRQWLLDQQLISESSMQQPAILQAQSLALCNSVRGVQWISVHAEQHFAEHPAVNSLKQAIQALGFR